MSKSFMEQEIGVDLLVHDIRVLIKAIKLPEKTKSGLITTESYNKDIERTYHIGLLLGFGDKAFDPETFGGKDASLCNIKIGDWVFYSSYERERMIINDHLCYMINDSRIYMTIPNPEEQLTKLVPELERYK